MDSVKKYKVIASSYERSETTVFLLNDSQVKLLKYLLENEYIQEDEDFIFESEGNFIDLA